MDLDVKMGKIQKLMVFAWFFAVLVCFFAVFIENLLFFSGF